MENNETIKVGDVFGVFDTTPSLYTPRFEYKWAAEKRYNWWGEVWGVVLPNKISSGEFFYILPKQARLVAKLRITKVK